jgi:rubrerythrin
MTLEILGIVLLVVLGTLIGRKIYQQRAFKAGRLKVCPHCGRYYRGNPTYCPHCGEVVAKWSGRR